MDFFFLFCFLCVCFFWGEGLIIREQAQQLILLSTQCYIPSFHSRDLTQAHALHIRDYWEIIFKDCLLQTGTREHQTCYHLSFLYQVHYF